MIASIPWLALSFTVLLLWATAEIAYGVVLIVESVIGRR